MLIDVALYGRIVRGECQNDLKNCYCFDKFSVNGLLLFWGQESVRGGRTGRFG
jgi:hypothetical protein